MSTHPAEVNEALGQAHSRCLRLIRDAENRGDLAGADAWRVALRSIESAEKAMRDAREAQTWRDQPPASPLIMPCGCPFGSHPAKQNYLQGAAERDGPVCDLGWSNSTTSVRQGDREPAESRESPEVDQANALELAQRLVGRSGSKWHDVDQRLARAVLRIVGLERQSVRGLLRDRDAARSRSAVERATANEHLTQLHDAKKLCDMQQPIVRTALAMRSRRALQHQEECQDGQCLRCAVDAYVERSMEATIARFARLGTSPEERCPDCDRQLATRDDFENHPETCQHCRTLCWREYHDGCVAPRVDWRARALAAEGAGAAAAHLRAALDAACDLGEPMRGPDDPRLHGPHRVELIPMFTTGLTREQLHERWAELRRMAGEPLGRPT